LAREINPDYYVVARSGGRRGPEVADVEAFAALGAVPRTLVPDNRH
jgi:hypothetical protein